MTIKFDLYKQPFRLLLPDEKDNYRTFCGAILTILSIIAVIVFASMKLSILFNYESYKVQIRNFEDNYSHEHRFTAKEGLAIAAGIVELSNDNA